ncbi:MULTISPECIES: iron-sulfur cluster carrier protein ApbC [unclassified Legionella]|uniref:iron-sulfur cluster carrier protein ApbC n=1 Tax=unclassified Legionella TaxID=2622702 RepID=UPI001056D7D4|nr:MULTISPECIES: iron-sulfur cluster carrier protein ApbC [unclassified Legionella]MDI9817644.1 iron-sulfur cluster carrier protein ApbC [Legionella sp. PL877]
MNLEDSLSKLLSSIKDKVQGLTATEMGLKPEITLKDNEIKIKLSAGFPTKPLEQSLLPLLAASMQNAFPKHRIQISFECFINAHRTQLIGKGLRGVKNTIAVASGKGGVGKSTVAVNLATALARAGAKVGLLDADIYGPSIPLMLGDTAGVQISNDRYLPVSAHGIQAMSIGYLTDSNEALIWRGPMLAKSLLQMLDITLWDELDYLFIDLPPGTGDIQLSLVQKIPLTSAIVVTTPQNVATLDAQKAIRMFEKTNIDLLGVVENMSLHVCSQCGHQEAIFGTGGGQKLSESFQVNLLGQLPLDSQIRSQSDEGKPTAVHHDKLAASFMNTAMRAAIELSKKPLNYMGKFPDIVVE